MYELARRVGRFGFEVQSTLLLHPRFLRFDPSSRKLGTTLDAERWTPRTPLPSYWHWVSDPSPKSAYLPGDALPDAEWAPWFLTDHHARFADSCGYNTYWVYRELDHVCFQLEMVTDPLDDTLSAARFQDEARQLYKTNLRELMEDGVAAPFTPQWQQRIKEQVSIEIDDVRWKARVDPLRKLMWWALGTWLLVRLRPRLTPTAPGQAALLGLFDADLAENARTLWRYDLLTNVALLLDGFFLGPVPELDWRWLRRIVTGRAHAALLAACYDNDVCYFHVHGAPELTADDLRQLSPRDLDLFRRLGIDPLMFDLLAGLPQPHLHPRRTRRLELQREALRWFLDLDGLGEFLRAGLLGGTPPVDAMPVPLFHPRKTSTPGCVYVEFRHLHTLKLAGDPRYPGQFMPVESPWGTLQVVFVGHLWNLAHDLAELMDVAIALGASVERAVGSGEAGFRRRDLDACLAWFQPRVEHVLRTYRRPPWHTEDQIRPSPAAPEGPRIPGMPSGGGSEHCSPPQK